MMNTNNYSNIVIMIPSSSTDDIHICGICRQHFYLLEDFVEHKFHSNCQPDVYHSKSNCPPSSKHSHSPETLGDRSVIVRNEPIIMKKRLETKVANEAAENSMRNLEKSKGSSTLSNTKAKSKIRYSCGAEGCSYTSLMKKDRDRHRRTHTGDKPFKCKHCEKCFSRDDKLLAHERIHNGDKRYRCARCDYAAVDGSSLRKHFLTHTGAKPYKCQLCNYSARSKSQLTVHLRMHTGDAPYICTVGKCNAAFRTTSDLKRHAAIHLPVKPHACQYCEFRTAIKGGLVSHIKKQHPNGEDGITKQYTCPHCPISFSTLRKQNYHIKSTHTGHHLTEGRTKAIILKRKHVRRKKSDTGIVKEYECIECGARFVSPASLRIHEKQHVKNIRTKSIESNVEYSKTRTEPMFNLSDKCDNLGLSPTYLSSPTNLHTAEMLASLAREFPTQRPFSDVSSDFFHSHDMATSNNDGIKFIDSSLIA